MANWCSNWVVFEGSEKAIEKVQRLFRSMNEEEAKTDNGQLPDFVTNTNTGFFFNICWSNGDKGIFQYETKWNPNTEVLQRIAEYYKVKFVQDYEEMDNLVYGRATFFDKVLTDIHLGSEDFESYRYDEENDTYHFQGKYYDSDCEILEILLERKIISTR